jgi:hypothetical protein
MKPLGSALAIMTLAVLGTLMASGAVLAQSNADYASTPPFIDAVATPNILIIMDNSGSMTNRACESSSCGILSSGATSTVTTFDATTRYNGFADPLRCYVWDATDNRFENGTAKAALNTACGTGEWDGNFVNWATFRRFDAVKKAMTGGNCWHPVSRPVRPLCRPSRPRILEPTSKLRRPSRTPEEPEIPPIRAGFRRPPIQETLPTSMSTSRTTAMSVSMTTAAAAVLTAMDLRKPS